MGEGFLSAVFEEPEWVKCACGNEAVKLDADTGRCWNCNKASERARALQRAMTAARIPPPMRWVRPEHPDLAVILGFPGSHVALGHRLHALVETTTLRTVTLLGNTKEGKTHMAIALLMPKLLDSLFIDASELASCEGKHRFGNGDAPSLAKAKRARVLVLDELKAPVDDRQRGVLEQVIWHRFAHGLRTVITSGLTKEELTAIFGDGARRRFGFDFELEGDRGEAKYINLTEERLKRAEANAAKGRAA